MKIIVHFDVPDTQDRPQQPVVIRLSPEEGESVLPLIESIRQLSHPVACQPPSLR